ncbi:hypothetical protein AVEN_249141-1 [Araneus ventricosus]|uniref:Uncharacterized protein n=1 Tax=Araneus ventricosus TaxID=182803 RepID=A0A4Y2D745_ARAVE|nr:hypothetical protein AVEN_249141-1 [Araneus ventricosus]
MFRGGPQTSAQDKQTQQQQKQKKRLSFRDPEVEGPQQSFFYGGCRPRVPSSRLLNERRESRSVENLSLEDQALQIVQNVGSAFSDLSLQELDQTGFFDIDNSAAEIEDKQAEALINDCLLTDSSNYNRGYQLSSLQISAEDQEFLDDLNPSFQSSDMRCPSNEASEGNPYRNSIPSMERTDEKYPSSAQHQIQLLKYQLDQQSQQTQLALHQVQLLTDQVEAESAARRKAQEQNNQLMIQNQELLSHIERLFQQIENLEKQIHVLEMGKRPKNPQPLEPQVTQLRTPPSYAAGRRMSGESTTNRQTATTTQGRSALSTTTTQGRNALSTTTSSRRTSLASTRPSITQNKQMTNQPQASLATRRNPLSAPKPLTGIQNKTADQNAKKKETSLHIGDTSPPVQSGTLSPFGSSWKLKSQDQNQSDGDSSVTGGARMRTSSFSSFSKLKPPENIGLKSTAFNSNSGIAGVSSITNKRFSSSTSDLYSTSAFQSTKPSVIEDASGDSKSSISNIGVNAASKLPRFQPYTGIRRSSLTKDFEQFSALGKSNSQRSNTQSSMFNR